MSLTQREWSGDEDSLGGVLRRVDSWSVSVPPLEANEEEGVSGGVFVGAWRRGEPNVVELAEANTVLRCFVMADSRCGAAEGCLLTGRDEARSREQRLLRG